MPYLFGFLCVLALMASPLSVGAQAGEEGTSAKPNAEEPVQSTEPTGSRPESWHPWQPDAFADAKKLASEPALELGVDSAGLLLGQPMTPSAPPTVEELERQKQQSKGVGIGVGVAVGVLVIFAVVLGVAAASVRRNVMKGHVPGPASMGPGTIVIRAR